LIFKPKSAGTNWLIVLGSRDVVNEFPEFCWRERLIRHEPIEGSAIRTIQFIANCRFECPFRKWL
jgi:hypothetical protein